MSMEQTRYQRTEQLFNTGVAIDAAVQPGAAIGGFGLRFSQDFTAPAATAVSNQGNVNSVGAVNTLQIDGNGGPISYSGNGSLINTASGGAGLFVDNVRGDISVATGWGQSAAQRASKRILPAAERRPSSPVLGQ